MCWETFDIKTYGHKRKAKDNIPVMKVCYLKDNGLESAYRSFHYVLNKTYHCKISKIITEKQQLLDGETLEIKQIYNGFHSYSPDHCIKLCGYLDKDIDCRACFICDKEDMNDSKYFVCYDELGAKVRDHVYFYGNDIAIVSCIIPKDSIYFVNEHNVYVSDKIKVLSYFKINYDGKPIGE